MKSIHPLPVPGLSRRKDLSRYTRLACGIALASGLTATEVNAQQAADAAAVTSGGTIEQIVVTARKVVEKLQEVPVTVTAFKADDIEKANIVKITDLNNLTPGMNFQDGTGRGGPGRFFIRGLTGGVAGTAPRGDLSPAPAHLVCKHRSGVCHQGRRGGGVVLESSAERNGPQRR